jgi:hypothetical protein
MALNFIPNTLLDPKEYFSSAAIALIITSVCISGFVTLVNVVAYRTLEKSLEEKTQSEII